MRNAKRRKRRGKFQRQAAGGSRKANSNMTQVVQPAGVVEMERQPMIHVLKATPAGEPTHAVCSLCQQHWHDDDPEISLAAFVRTHLRAGFKYDRYTGQRAPV